MTYGAQQIIYEDDTLNGIFIGCHNSQHGLLNDAEPHGSVGSELQESMDRCTGHCDIIEILLKKQSLIEHALII